MAQLLSRQPLSTPKLSVSQIALRGLGTGLVATQALDILSILFYEGMHPETRRQEDAARNGRQAYEEAVAKIARLAGRDLTDHQIKYWGWKFHRTFGVIGGLQYIYLRQKYPSLAKGMGLKFGLGFFLVADQFLIYVLGLTPGPQKFSWKAHLRGAVAHIAWGVAAEMMARAYDRITPYERGLGPAAAEKDKDRAPERSLRSMGSMPAYM